LPQVFATSIIKTGSSMSGPKLSKKERKKEKEFRRKRQTQRNLRSEEEYEDEKPYDKRGKDNERSN